MHDNIKEFPLLPQGKAREELQVESLSDFLAAIEDVRKDSAQEFDNKNGIPHLWFRGQDSIEQPDGSWKLIPKLQRFVSIGDERKYFETESAINNDFQSRASVFFESKPDTSDFASWLTLMQHYGFPTRLLDWSRSPLYALFFATADHTLDDRDACIWILNPGLLNGYAHLEDKPYLYHMGHKKVIEVLWPAFRVTDYSKDKKRRIFNQLYDSGITHSVVFPDLEHVSKDVQRLYGIEKDLASKAKKFGNS